MRSADAPPEQFVRLGLPALGEVTAEHLVLARQGEVPTAAPLDATAFAGSVVARATVRELLDAPHARAVLRSVLGEIVDGPLPAEALDMTLLDIATVTVGMVPPEAVHAVASMLDDADTPR